MLQSQWWDEGKLRELQVARLRYLAQHAYTNTSHYRRVFDDAGVDPKTLQLEDLGRLPMLEKRMIQADGQSLVASSGVRRSNDTRANQTGGSTGEPIHVLQSHSYRIQTTVELIRDHVLCGYRVGDPYVYLWGSDYDSRAHTGIAGRIKDYVQNLSFLNTFRFNEESMATFAKSFRRNPPTLVVGYVSSLVVFARLMQRLDMSWIRPRGVQTAAEQLTATQRKLIGDSFASHVFNRYGCREVGNIAHECEQHEGLHVMMENNIVEVVKSDGTPAAPGDLGYVVVTNLHNDAMPFIRYRIGDLAVAGQGQCACGRGLAIIRDVVGRTSDIITAPSGRLIHGEFFTHLFYKLRTVDQFQIEQTSLKDLVVTIKPGTGFGPADEEFLRRAIHEHADAGFDVRFVLSDRIAPNAAGKLRFTVSQVPLPAGLDKDSD